MKDKRIYLKIACILEFIYITIMLIYYLLFTKFGEMVVAESFLLLINLFLSVSLYKESNKAIKDENKIKILLISLWFLFEPVIPGVISLIYLSSIKEKKKVELPILKKEDKNMKAYVKSVIMLLIFLFLMFVLPRIFKLDLSYLVYFLIVLFVLIFYFKELKESFNVFKENLRVYVPFIFKRYFIMLGLMFVVSVPIVLLNKGVPSSNQQLVNVMLKEFPIKTFLLSVFYAPFAEESVFRLSLSKLFNNKTVFIILSGFFFGALHLIDKFTSVYDLLYVFQYMTLGICLAKAYADTDNIFVSMSMHFIQNFLSAVLVLLLF